MFRNASPGMSRRFALVLGSVALFASAAVFAAPPVNTLKGGLFGGRTDTAILGYDTVAYFTDGKAVKGQDALATEWMGAKWKFASQAHLVSIEPDKFKVVDGKLHLNYDAEVQTTWNKDIAGYIKQADAKFARLLKK